MGRPLLASFLRVFNGAERISALWDLQALSRKGTSKHSPARMRNFNLAVMLLCGAFYETLLALNGLNAARVDRFVERSNEHLAALNQIRKTWVDDALLNAVRNQVAHHLGYQEDYEKGLAKYVGRSKLVVIESFGHTVADHAYPASQAVLWTGLDFDIKRLSKFMDDILPAFTDLQFHAQGLIVDVLHAKRPTT